MRYLALACDYDGTLASEGRVAPETVGALERLRASGRRLLLVTGREAERPTLRLPSRPPLRLHRRGERGGALSPGQPADNPAERATAGGVCAEPPGAGYPRFRSDGWSSRPGSPRKFP
jgi:hypothetical protein